MPPEASNPQLLLYTLYRRGGGSGYVDLEDLFEECYRLFPSRFGWKTKPHPSDKAGDQAIRHVIRGRALPEGLLRLSDDRGAARLSAEGVSYVRSLLERFEHLADERAPSRRPSQRHLVELEQSAIGKQILANGAIEASRAQIANLLRLAPDADADAFTERLAAWRSDAETASRTPALAILDRLAAGRPAWFKQGEK